MTGDSDTIVDITEIEWEVIDGSAKVIMRSLGVLSVLRFSDFIYWVRDQ